MKQNIWLWQCEKCPQDNQWDESHLFDRINGMVEHLCYSLRRGRLRLYFNPDVNLLKDDDWADMIATADKIEEYLNDIKLTVALLEGPSPGVN